MELKKNGTESLVGQVVFKLRIETVKIMFLIPWTIYYRMHILFFKKVLIILR